MRARRSRGTIKEVRIAECLWKTLLKSPSSQGVGRVIAVVTGDQGEAVFPTNQ